MAQKIINITIPDLIVGIQETVLCIRHGRKDETAGSHGEFRRELYREANKQLHSRELDFTLVLRHNNYDFHLRVQRFYHHRGRVYRVCYIEGENKSVFKEMKVKPVDFNLVQLAEWAAVKHFSTPPVGSSVRYFQLSENPNAEDPVVATVDIPIPSLDHDVVSEMIFDRLCLIEGFLETPDSDLPECNEDERFSLLTDPYCKCRTSCRARDFCSQYGKVRALAVSELAGANKVLATV